MDAKQVKLELMKAAATLAAGVASRLPALTKTDAMLADPDTQAEDLEVWRINEVFYSGLLNALNANQGVWIDPPAIADATSSGPVADLAGEAANIIKALPAGSVQGIIGQILSAIPKASPAAPIPAPGPAPAQKAA